MADYIGEIRKIIEKRIIQLKVEKFSEKFNVNKREYAVLGKGISYSLSPVMHNSVFSELGMNCKYKIVDGSLEECINWLRKKGSGANVTIPYKQEVIKFLDELSEEAKEIGAVNTIKKTEDGKLIGYNTDYIAIRELLEDYPGKVIIFGSGGAARAVGYALKGREVLIVSRNPEKVDEIYYKWGIKIIGYDEVEKEIKEAKIIINASPSVPEIADFIDKDKILFDMRYNPLDVGLNKIALEKGAKIIHGLEMLAIQAAEAQRIWFGKRANSDLMLKFALDNIS